MAAFEGKTIAVTGGASGMGLAIAKLLAERGARISLADVNESGLKTAVSTLAGSQDGLHSWHVVDVRSTESVDAWIEATLKAHGRLDGAVNFAGVITKALSVDESTDEDWDFVMGVNATGVWKCLRAQIRAMKRLGGTGSIVSASSTFGQIGAPGNVAYCASKAAVIAMTRTAAKENQTIRVNCVAPGSVNTPLSASEDPEHVKRGSQATVQKRRAEPIEVARVVAFLLSEDASFVTGACYNVDGGWVC